MKSPFYIMRIKGGFMMINKGDICIYKRDWEDTYFASIFLGKNNEINEYCLICNNRCGSGFTEEQLKDKNRLPEPVLVIPHNELIEFINSKYPKLIFRLCED